MIITPSPANDRRRFAGAKREPDKRFEASTTIAYQARRHTFEMQTKTLPKLKWIEQAPAKCRDVGSTPTGIAFFTLQQSF